MRVSPSPWLFRCRYGLKGFPIFSQRRSKKCLVVNDEEQIRQYIKWQEKKEKQLKAIQGKLFD
jgi:hypothetical protein